PRGDGLRPSHDALPLAGEPPPLRQGGLDDDRGHRGASHRGRGGLPPQGAGRERRRVRSVHPRAADDGSGHRPREDDVRALLVEAPCAGRRRRRAREPEAEALVNASTFGALCVSSLFTVIDPIGVAPIFASMSARSDARARRRLALRACLAALVVLALFAFGGSALLRLFGVTI